MPAGVSWTSYLKMFAASLLAMCAGAEVVHRYYRPDLSSGTEQPLGAAQVTPSPRCLNLYGSKKNCFFSLKSAAMPEYTFIVISILPSPVTVLPPIAACRGQGEAPLPTSWYNLSYTQVLEDYDLSS
ncbi:ubiquinol-cytochrome c reductase complex assembly factor 6 isoform X1 [Sagmatias obliquidens]|uniref:ubiquinol-cytochrome c reductase complex assembly factor 6 isoform X1 n=1 Tax=Sagmatias obliquidens TaxID=3371155 RepID=UPI000F43F153|nr:uncharacterized protein C12orf73 homolog isoform X1 [Lagenorhynchus obliquidens]